MAEQLDMFECVECTKLKKELANLRNAYDTLALQYSQETTPTMTVEPTTSDTGEIYSNERLENGQRRRIPRRELEDWEQAGVPKELMKGWSK